MRVGWGRFWGNLGFEVGLGIREVLEGGLKIGFG